MENNMLKDILEQKAVEVKQHLTSLDYDCTYVLTVKSYRITFTIDLAGRNAKFFISYTPTKDTWKLTPVNEGVTSELLLCIAPLIGQSTTPIALSQVSTVAQTEPSIYFEAALECLRILQPFAREYIDFSIICDQVKIGLQGILTNSRYAYLDHKALQQALQKPSLSDFSYAKEYLMQCLMLCHLPTQF